jgi:hypothetical protein
MTKSQTPKLSSALTLIKHVWDHSLEATGHSWERLNHSMYSAVKLAINAGMAFEETDFRYIADNMRIGYWSGCDSGEDWYSLAINKNHASAAHAYEYWRGRKPFLIQPTDSNKNRIRLHVGAIFDWHHKLAERVPRVKVTSFSKDQSAVIAVRYKDFQDGPISKRFRITHEDIREYHAALKRVTVPV